MRRLPATEVRAGARHLRSPQYAPYTPSGAALMPDAPTPASESGA
ncbi:hypothetical protein [Streptomyces niveus]